MSSHVDSSYHQHREQQCRELAGMATDPNIRRRHEELAALHATRAALAGASPRQPAI